MIIPINNGKTITPIYIPHPVVTTNYSILQQSDNTQSSEPTLGTWIVGGIVIIFLIVFVTYIIKLSKYILGGKE